MTSHSTETAQVIFDQLAVMIKDNALIEQKIHLVEKLEALGNLSSNSRKLEHSCRTILTVALFANDIALATLLLEKRVNPVTEDMNGDNALTAALINYTRHYWALESREHVDLIELIIDTNPKCLESRSKGSHRHDNTPLHQVAQASQSLGDSVLFLFALLVAKGANRHCKNNCKETPLEILLREYSLYIDQSMTKETLASRVEEAVKAYKDSKNIEEIDINTKLRI